MERPPRSAFITTRQGFRYLTVKSGRRNCHLRRIHNYTLEAQDKRDLRRLHPDILFDWKKIDRQLAEKREVCRGYRSRRQRAAAARRGPRDQKPLSVVYDPFTRTIYPEGNLGAALPLLDTILRRDRAREGSSPTATQAKPAGKLEQ